MIVTDFDQLAELVTAYKEFDSFVFDVETKGSHRLDPVQNEVFWISLAGPGRADVIPMGHPLGNVLRYEAALTKTGKLSKAQNATPTAVYGKPPMQLWPEEVFGALEDLFFSDREKIGHNVKFDVESVAKYFGGLIMPGPFFGTDIAAHLLNENWKGFKPYSLGSCCHRELGFYWEKSIGAESEKHPFNIAARYSYFDAKYTWLLAQHYKEMLEEDGFLDLFNLESMVTEVVCHMEMAGVHIDTDAIKKVEASFAEELEETYRKICDAAGNEWPTETGEINLNADAQVRKLVYEIREHKPIEWTTKTQEPSIRAQVLEEYAEKDEIVAACIHWASLNKMQTTFVQNIRGRLINGKIHCQFDQRGARTGRFSSREPNLQNIPTRQTKVIRDMFMAPPGWKLIVADYSQIELRLLAHFSQDPVLVQAYVDGLNLHTLTAEKAFSTKEPNKLQYSYAKNTNFTLVFGGSPETIANRYTVPLKIARVLHKAFYDTYRRVEPWRKAVVLKTKKNRVSEDYATWSGKKACPPYTTTITGRRRRLPEIFWNNNKDRAYAERQAVSHVIQGSAGDINKYALVNVHRFIKENKKDWHIIITVHDELVARVPEAEAEEAAAAIKYAMENLPLPVTLRVPLLVDVDICSRWSEKS